MAERDPLQQPIPEAEVESGGGFSIVWLIPLVALIVGGWLVYKALSERGPTITISFDYAEGLEAGKTRIRYKDVDVGKVKDIQLSYDLSHVVVTAELSRSVGEHLNENSRFWIVRPRISTTGVSGLSTLISGIYIAMEPGEGETYSNYFMGLNKPPQIEHSAEGASFVLHADDLGSLDIGSPVYYRRIQVGEVTQYALDEAGRSVRVTIFINAPHHRLVRRNSRFWNASGFDLSLDARGISAKLESLTAFVVGGIAFETPLNLDAGSPAEDGDEFILHPSKAEIHDRDDSNSLYYVMHFDGSLRGLNPGAPLEYRGIKVGEVIDIDMRLDHETLEVDIPVLVAMYPDRISISGKVEDHEKVMDLMVERGLRAQLKSGNLLTGQLFVDLDFVADAPPATIARGGSYAEFPTLPATMDKITRNATDLLDKIDRMPLLEIATDIRDTVKGLNQIINSPASQETLKELNATLAQLHGITKKFNRDLPALTAQTFAALRQMEETLATADAVIAEDSPLYYEIRQMIEEMTETAESFESLTDYLQRNPSALLYGKKGLER